MRPPRILVIQILYRCPLHQVEEKYALVSSNSSFILQVYLYRNRERGRRNTVIGNSDIQIYRYTYTYDANHRRSHSPAKFPPHEGIISNHVAQSIIETVHAKCPANRYTLEKDEEEKTKSGDGVRVEDLEDVHATLGNAR